MKRTPIIIDCDPGVDDSFAIALAYSRPELEIVAITAVEGNVPASLTRRNALGLCETLGINCRVGFGMDRPLKRPYQRDASDTHGKSGVGSVVFDEITLAPDPLPAWEIIYQEAVKHEGELVLFAVGPLTNIAMCLMLHPDLPKHLKRLVIMGGGTFGNVRSTGLKAEFNAWIDPTAAKIVIEGTEVYMVGLNATHAAAVSVEDFDEMIALCGDKYSSGLVRELCRFSRRNHVENGSDNNCIHDALAVASLIDPLCVGFEHHYVYVEDREDAHNVGETVIDLSDTSGKAKNCHVAMTVDKKRFADLLKDMCRHYASL